MGMKQIVRTKYRGGIWEQNEGGGEVESGSIEGIRERPMKGSEMGWCCLAESVFWGGERRGGKKLFAEVVDRREGERKGFWRRGGVGGERSEIEWGGEVKILMRLFLGCA